MLMKTTLITIIFLFLNLCLYAQKNFSFVFLPDIHLQNTASGISEFDSLVQDINSINPDFVYTGGDMIFGDISGGLKKAEKLFQLFKRKSGEFNMPVYFTIGNHEKKYVTFTESGVDIKNELWGNGLYEKYFGKRYYSFERDGWKFIALDGFELDTLNRSYSSGIDSIQLEWLKNELSNTNSAMPIVLLCHPPLANPKAVLTSEENLFSESSIRLINLFKDHNLRLVLQGHNHLYMDLQTGTTRYISGGEPKIGNKVNSGIVLVTVNGDLLDAKFLKRPLPVKGVYIAGDFHQHTTYSGGSFSMGYVMDACAKYGLDWWANNDHGGVRELCGAISGTDTGINVSWTQLGVNLEGDKHPQGFMWRWQSLKDWCFKDIELWKRIYPNKTIIQGFEWNVPGHQHADVGLIANQFNKDSANCNPLAQFEYMFDAADKDTTGGLKYGWVKSKKGGHDKTIEAIHWMQQNYPKQGWVIPTHPERGGDYRIEDLRDMNNASEGICFGFDGQPGHQKGKTRGFGTENAYGIGEFDGKLGATFGGTGIMAAKLGGVWDAMLSEGRKWWIFANSDFHSLSDFHPGEYQKTYTFVEKKNDAQAILNGLRSGNSFIVDGDLITDLKFSVDGAMMGETLYTNKRKVTVLINVYDPETNNYNTYSDYTNPRIDHIDLISGKITGRISPQSIFYKIDHVETVKTIARFDAKGGVIDDQSVISRAWEDMGDGWKKMTIELDLGSNSYFRLRGTNNALNTKGEVDSSGNPLPDIEGENSPSKAFNDLWFYSNPIFVIRD